MRYFKGFHEFEVVGRYVFLVTGVKTHYVQIKLDSHTWRYALKKAFKTHYVQIKRSANSLYSSIQSGVKTHYVQIKQELAAQLEAERNFKTHYVQIKQELKSTNSS